VTDEVIAQQRAPQKGGRLAELAQPKTDFGCCPGWTGEKRLRTGERLRRGYGQFRARHDL